MRKIIKIFTILSLAFILSFASSCDFSSSTNENDTNDEYSEAEQLIDIYKLAAKQGYTGTYGDWINELKGETVEIRSFNGYIQWRYTNSDTWTNLIYLSELKGEDGVDGLTPYIGENGNWWIGDEDTGVKAEGTNGTNGQDGLDGLTPYIGENGNWWIGDEDTGVKAKGTNGEDGQDGVPGKSAYDIYRETHPEYNKTEDEWIQDLINGELVTNKHLVTFDSNGGSEIKSQEVLNGYKATKPENPTRLGYTFDGWYIDDEEWVFVGYPVTEDVTLTANWIQNEYLITLNSEGEETDYIIHYDEEFGLPKLVKEGYVFEGWFDEEGNKYESGRYLYLDDLYLTASFRLYRVTFDTNGGNEISYYESEEYIVNKLPEPVKEGYVFYGWYSNNELVDAPFEYASDVTLVAKWININEEFSYISLDDTSAKVVKYNGTKTDVVIPEEIDGYTIVEITSDVFSSKTDIKSVVLPSTLITIEDGLLEGCNQVESIQISDDIPTTLKNLYNVSTSSDLPNTLTTIKYNDGSTSNNSSFFVGVSKKFIIYLASDLTQICNFMFRDCGYLKELIISESVTSIGDCAFLGCNSLTSILIPKGIRSFDTAIFSDCTSLKNVYYDGTIDDWCKISFDITSVTTCGDLRYYSFASNPMSYADYIYILDSNGDVEYDGKKYSLPTTLNISEEITCIKQSTFMNWKSLTNVVINKKLETIESSAFKGCISLTNINISKKVTSIGICAFEGCISLTSITIPEGVTIIENSVFKDCTSLTNIIMSEGVTKIGGGAFYGCNGLKKIDIPEGVTKIGGSTFEGCTSLTSITIPEGVTIIENGIFSECGSLASITIPEGVTSIGHYAFEGCTSLTSITIPKGVTSIGQFAFERCISLTSITIPEGVTSLGYLAFSNCNNLTVYYYGTQEQWNSLNATDVTEVVYVPVILTKISVISATLTAINTVRINVKDVCKAAEYYMVELYVGGNNKVSEVKTLINEDGSVSIVFDYTFTADDIAKGLRIKVISCGDAWYYSDNVSTEFITVAQ